MCTHLLLWELQNCNPAEQPSTGECWIPPKRDTPHPRAKEKPQQDGRRGKITFKIKPRTCQRFSEGSNKPCVHYDPETPKRLSQNCVWVSPAKVQVSNSLPQGLWVQQTWVWHKPSWKSSLLTPPWICQNSNRTGETDPWRALTEPCVHQDPWERSSDPTGDWPRLAHECPGVSSRGVGWQWPAAGLGGTWVWQCLHQTFWRRSPLSSLPPP